MRLLDEIAVLLGVYKLHILAVGDCLTDVSTIQVIFADSNIQIAARGQRHLGYKRLR